jgi:hypothetical protein
MSDFVKTHTHTHDPSTSRQAAASAIPTAKTQKDALLEAFHSAGPMTADEACFTAGLPKYPGRQRVTDLYQEGLIVDTGQTRAGDSGRKMRVMKEA